MRGGDLDRRITIQRPATVETEWGPQEGGWEDVVARLPAQVWDNLPSQSESVQGGLRLANRPGRVRIRYMRGLSSDMRIIVHDEEDRICEMSSEPAEIGRREWTEFTIQDFSS